MIIVRGALKKPDRSFYDRDAIAVAEELLGKYLVHRVEGLQRIGRIVEVEAYLGPHDRASHAAKGLTDRTRILFGPAGRAYVYLIYGRYHCLNVVTGPADEASAVLLRALEPIRHIAGRTQGPGLLCAAMGIDRRLNGCDLTGGTLYIAAEDSARPPAIVRSRRVGVAYAGRWALEPLRFYIQGNPYVSRTRQIE